ncbi:MAG: bifunctional 4-hydroxy-2-oxoglutarate aldolase/2-dehydro-3-deoxy-phosphogluconate aldolase [Acidobacteriaceae bacterium]
MMDKSTIMQHMRELGLVPVLRATSAEEAMPLADAILAGGIDILEVTMTVPGAIRVIEQLADHHGDKLLLGAGTVLDAETARNCLLAGAQFIVSPALDLRTIELCRRYSVPVMPGALTPTEILTAWQAGADVVKVFPCSALGGAKYLKALQGPLPQIQIIPTGGVSLGTAEEFLAAGAFALGVGGDLVDAKAAREGRTSVITENARKYLAIVKKFRSSRS